MKKFISTLLALAMSLSVGVVSFAADISFSDVTKDDWFYDDIKTVVELGLINGKSGDRYAPNDNLTYAEAIKLAACMNQFYTTGAVTLANGNPWYQPYVDYCMANGIIDKTYNYEENATRAGYMTIFAKALPDEALKEINNVPDNAIPDVPATKDYASAVYKLYRAGIINGIDDKHNCEPLINISRKEVAAIVARMMYEHKRIDFTIVSVDDTQTDEDNAEQGEVLEYVGNETTTYEALIFSKTPSDVSIDCGQTATFQTEVLSGRKPFTYQWQYLNDDSWTDFEDTEDENFNVTGATQTTLTIESSVPDITEIRCVVTDSVGKEHETQSVKLTVNAILLTEEWNYAGTYITDDDAADDIADNDVDEAVALEIEKQPKDASVAIEQTAKFTVEVSGGTAPYSYQWQNQIEVAGRKKWQNLENIKEVCSGAKSKTLSLTSPTEGGMLLRCVITDDNGNKVITNLIKFTVTEKKITLPSRRNLS